MLFNSLEFALFLPVVFLIYWWLNSFGVRKQNLFLITASYIFYGWWDWRFLLLIVLSSAIDFWVSRKLAAATSYLDRKILLGVSLGANLGLLFFFKYYNFFLQSFVDAFLFFGSPLEMNTLSIVLPVGISFYTFQTLSYSIDVYNRRIAPTNDATAFFAYVSFFPQLVAGPIERARNFLPQFTEERSFKYQTAVDGLRQMLGGLFKKVVIADSCATYVNEIFGNYQDHSGSTLVLGAIFFAFQIYGDFSGYSDIAIGCGRLFGFSLSRNFAYPYFSRNIAEFWRRWHLSLSGWFRDYVYIPLGGNRGGITIQLRNVFIVFIVSGLWHGANWTFIAWGLIHALCFLPNLLMGQNRKYLDEVEIKSLGEGFRVAMSILTTFSVTTIAWIFFRSESIGTAIGYLRRVFSMSLLEFPALLPKTPLILIVLLVATEWFQRKRPHALYFLASSPRWLRWSTYLGLSLWILLSWGDPQEFIYFQF